MGTNYYLHMGVCKHCGRGEEVLHIGKSSAGWCFSLHVIPDANINTLKDWIRMFELKDTLIKNEYGEVLTKELMLSVIRDRRATPWQKHQWGRNEQFGIGYDSEQQFHKENQSERGPRGLARAKLGAHCVGHGKGTWDYIAGEFS